MHWTTCFGDSPVRLLRLCAAGILLGAATASAQETFPAPSPSLTKSIPSENNAGGELVVQPRTTSKSVGGPGRMIGARYDYEYREAGSPGYARMTGESDGTRTAGGFFPTQMETQLLPPNNPDYTRAKGDGSYWGYSGIWPVQPATDNYYQRHGAFYDRVERGLGLFIPEENVLAHSNLPDAWSIDLDYGLPFLTRDVAPDRTMVKLGPLYLDVLGVTFSALFTDYSGDAPLDPDVPEEGWIGIVSIPIRAAIRLTDSIYIQATAYLYYLPMEGEVGVGSGTGAGLALGTNARLNFEWERGSWMFRVYDYLGSVSNVADLNESWGVNELSAVGRYRYGALGDVGESNQYWDPRFGGIRNDIGVEAQTPVTGDWWFLASAVHSDYWVGPDSDAEDEFSNYDQVALLYTYMGDELMFAPSFSYNAGSPDYFETITHRVETRLTGRVTEYLVAYASAGYLWQTGDTEGDNDSLLWEAGVTHELTPYTRHNLSGGQTFELSETLDEYLGKYVRYSIEHQFGTRLSASAFAQYQDAKRLGDETLTKGWLAGARARYALGNDTGLTAGVTYALNETPASAPSGNGPDEETWTYFASLDRPLLSRLYGNATYQYIDQTGPIGSNMQEHLLILSLNLTF